MATCIKFATYNVTLAATGQNGNYDLAVLDTATPLATCSFIAINSQEYQSMNAILIQDKATAEAIAGPLIALLAVGFIYKAVRAALNVGDSLSDEKH